MFVGGSSIYYAQQPSAGVAWIAGVLTALFAALMTGSLITPDLLGSGLFLLGFAVFLAALERPRVGSALASGVLLALAYLAKSIFLPLAAASCLTVWALRLWDARHDGRARDEARRTLGPVGLAALAFVAVAGPWIAALSGKYDRPTFTRATIAQWAIIGPKDIRRDQPTNLEFYVPEPGRQSQFEDESILPVKSWSPLRSVPYFVHYVWHIQNNVIAVQPRLLQRIDLLNAGFLALLVFFTVRALRLRAAGPFVVPGRWPLLAVPTLLVLAAYALNFGDQLRYYLVVVPGVFLGALVGWQRVGTAVAGPAGRRVGLAVATLSLALPITLLRNDLSSWTQEGSDSEQARALAPQLARAGLRGPVAAVGVWGIKHPAIFLSHFLGTTFHGMEDARSPAAVARSCARLLVLEHTNPIVETLLRDDGGYVRVEAVAPELAAPMRAARYALLWKTAPANPADRRYSAAGKAPDAPRAP